MEMIIEETADGADGFREANRVNARLLYAF